MPSTAAQPHDRAHPDHRARSPRTRTLPALLLAALALLAAAVLAAPAAAAPAARPAGAVQENATAPARPPSAAGPHCVLAAGAGQTARCFATFPAAIAAATGGRVTDAPASPATAAGDPAFAAELAAVTTGSVLVGIEYADLNFGGSSLSMTASGSCDNSLDADYRFPTLPSGWNDRISSFRSYSNCAQQLFRDTYFGGGALTNIVTSMSYVGSAANDKASSLTFN